MRHDLPCRRHAKNALSRKCSNNILDSQTWAFSKVWNNYNNNPIIKLGSIGHKSLKYYAYFLFPWPCTIILVRLMGNCLIPKIILLATWNLKSAIFAWSNLSWITHKNSSFDRTNSNFQIWYMFLHESWCKICFINFNSYSFASLLLFPNFNIKSVKDSHTLHFAKIKPLFHTSTLRWCFFLNLPIINWKIPPMFNSLFICIENNWINETSLFSICHFNTFNN